MPNIQEVFKRYEKKYLLDEKQYNLVLGGIREKMCPDEYGRSTICSLYFDTPDWRLVRKSLGKPVYKEKLRLRSYGVPDNDDFVFVELKKKYKGVVYKRRISLPLEKAEDALLTYRMPQNTQVGREIDWFLNYYPHLAPMMYVSYSRVAYFGKEDSNLRMTFDCNIRFRQEALALEAGTWGAPLLEPSQYLLEIKIPGTMPLWLSHLLDKAKAFPISFSKYGNAYLYAFGKSIVREEVLCHA